MSIDKGDQILRRRLERLAEAVPVGPMDPTPASHQFQVAVTSRLPTGLILIGVLVAASSFFLVTRGSFSGAGTGGPTGSLVVSPTPTGLTKDQAISAALEQAQPGATVLSALPMNFGDAGAGTSQPANRLVWVVRFWVVFPYCLPGPSPEPSPCVKPAPGPWTVILDYYSGETLTSFGGSQ